MLKNILKLDGVSELSKTEKRSVKGGLACIDGRCPRPGTFCCPPYPETGEMLCRYIGETCPG